jgi:stage II sporulation protein D
VRRARFLILAASPLLTLRPVWAQSDADPASSSARQALRVLLGQGEATPASPDTFSFQGRLYRGQFARLDDGQIVNLVDLEAYLCSVVPGEMPSRWPPEALQTQAICARTYVLQRSDPRRSYDLVPSELDQVYKGMQGESPLATVAVTTTAGRVLRFGGAFARVAYSSCCGGRTEAAADVWGSGSIPYLNGVPCTSCAASPNFRWTVAVTLESIAGSLSASLAQVGALQDLRIASRDASGRTRAFELVGASGSTTVGGSVFRRAVGPRTLRSLLIASLQRSPDAQQFEITGGGLGHGVGLCQWGARGMALDGADAATILAHYFPGTSVEDLA